MSNFNDLLRPETVLADVVVANRKLLFHQLGQLSQQAWRFDAKTVADHLGARERLASTGCGGGIAIPHARIEGVDRVLGAFLRLDTAVEFGAIDDLPVDLVFMLLSPSNSGAEHLKALARVSRTLRDKRFADKVRGAETCDAIYALFAGLETRDAA